MSSGYDRKQNAGTIGQALELFGNGWADRFEPTRESIGGDRTVLIRFKKPMRFTRAGVTTPPVEGVHFRVDYEGEPHSFSFGFGTGDSDYYGSAHGPELACIGSGPNATLLIGMQKLTEAQSPKIKFPSEGRLGFGPSLRLGELLAGILYPMRVTAGEVKPLPVPVSSNFRDRYIKHKETQPTYGHSCKRHCLLNEPVMTNQGLITHIGIESRIIQGGGGLVPAGRYVGNAWLYGEGVPVIQLPNPTGAFNSLDMLDRQAMEMANRWLSQNEKREEPLAVVEPLTLGEPLTALRGDGSTVVWFPLSLPITVQGLSYTGIQVRTPLSSDGQVIVGLSEQPAIIDGFASFTPVWSSRYASPGMSLHRVVQALRGMREQKLTDLVLNNLAKSFRDMPNALIIL